MTTENNADSNTIDFKTARENSGLTLKQLFERTRISVVNLEAIENGDFHLLPVPIYTRNFIKTYANALGVDGKPVLQRYENYLQTLQTKEEQQQTVEQPPDASWFDLVLRYKAYLWALLIIIVFAGVAFFVSMTNQPTPEAPQIQQPPAKTATVDTPAQNTAQSGNLPGAMSPPDQEQAGAAQKQPEQKAAGQQIQSASAAGVPNGKTELESLLDDEESTTLMIYAIEETWIRIQADDKEPFQVLLRPGEKISRKAARFNMDIGNAGGVRIQFDGKNLENLGKSGQVIHLRLP